MRRFAIQKPLLTMPPLGDILKHNHFHQSKLGRDVELQNTHIVLFKSPRDVMQLTTVSTKLALGSEQVDWYRDATSVPSGHLLIDLSPRTDDRLRYCTNSGSDPSKFYIPERLKHLRTLDDEHTKSLYYPSVPMAFPQKPKPLSSVLPERFIRLLCECIINLLKGNLQAIKRYHVVKIQDEVWLLSLKKLLGSKEETFCRQKKFATNSSQYTSRHYSFVLIWSSLFSSQLLCIARV